MHPVEQWTTNFLVRPNATDSHRRRDDTTTKWVMAEKPLDDAVDVFYLGSSDFLHGGGEADL